VQKLTTIQLSKHADRYQVGFTKMLAPTLLYKAAPQDLIQSRCSNGEITIDFIRIQFRLMLYTPLLPFCCLHSRDSNCSLMVLQKKGGNVNSNAWEVEYWPSWFWQCLFNTKGKIL